MKRGVCYSAKILVGVLVCFGLNHYCLVMAASGPSGSKTNPISVTNTSYSSVTNLLKTSLINRENSCRIYVKKTDSDSDYNTIIDNVWNAATSYLNAGSSNVEKLGDYLAKVLIKHRHIVGIDESVYYFDFKMQYSDGAEVEADVASSISELITSLSLGTKTQFQKDKAVNDYYWQNYTLSYNYDAVNPYVALQEKSGDSEVINILFQRTLVAAKINARLIKGLHSSVSDRPDEFYWVLSKIGAYWYNNDILHDILLPVGECLNGGLLKSNADFVGFERFPEYDTEEWNSAQPMASKSYDMGSCKTCTCPTKE